MLQKEYINLDRVLGELQAQQDAAREEQKIVCVLSALPAPLYLFVFTVILSPVGSPLYTAIVWSVFALLCALPVWQWIAYTRSQKESEARMQALRPVVVRSKLSSKQEKELFKHEGSRYKKRRYRLSSYFEDDPREYQMGYWYDWYVLYFPEGRFVTPCNNFPWSEEYAMTDKGLFLHAQPGDEFYLLIGQTLGGKPKREILFAYPAKLFRWEESEIRESDEQQTTND